MKLEDLHKTPKPAVPYNYFNELPGKIVKKATNSNQKQKVFKLNYYWSVAASVVLLIGASFLSNIFDANKTTPKNKTSMEAKEMSYYEYVDLYISDFEASELYISEKESEIDEYLLEESDVEQIIELL